MKIFKASCIAVIAFAGITASSMGDDRVLSIIVSSIIIAIIFKAACDMWTGS